MAVVMMSGALGIILGGFRNETTTIVCRRHAPPRCSPSVIHSTVARPLAEAWLAAPGETLARAARIVPAMRDGQPIGFKLYAIRPGSPYELIGLRNGDIILSIEGYDVTAPDKALELYARIKDGPPDPVVLEVERDGCPLTIIVSAG